MIVVNKPKMSQVNCSTNGSNTTNGKACNADSNVPDIVYNEMENMGLSVSSLVSAVTLDTCFDESMDFSGMLNMSSSNHRFDPTYCMGTTVHTSNPVSSKSSTTTIRNDSPDRMLRCPTRGLSSSTVLLEDLLEGESEEDGSSSGHETTTDLVGTYGEDDNLDPFASSHRFNTNLHPSQHVMFPPPCRRSSGGSGYSGYSTARRRSSNGSSYSTSNYSSITLNSSLTIDSFFEESFNNNVNNKSFSHLRTPLPPTLEHDDNGSNGDEEDSSNDSTIIPSSGNNSYRVGQQQRPKLVTMEQGTQDSSNVSSSVTLDLDLEESTCSLQEPPKTQIRPKLRRLKANVGGESVLPATYLAKTSTTNTTLNGMRFQSDHNSNKNKTSSSDDVSTLDSTLRRKKLFASMLPLCKPVRHVSRETELELSTSKTVMVPATVSPTTPTNTVKTVLAICSRSDCDDIGNEDNYGIQKRDNHPSVDYYQSKVNETNRRDSIFLNGDDNGQPPSFPQRRGSVIDKDAEEKDEAEPIM